MNYIKPNTYFNNGVGLFNISQYIYIMQFLHLDKTSNFNIVLQSLENDIAVK